MLPPEARRRDCTASVQLVVTPIDVHVQEGLQGAEGHTHKRAHKAARLRRHYAKLLMGIEWLIEVPATLGPAWRVAARPEGKRCLLIASKCGAAPHGTLLHIVITASTRWRVTSSCAAQCMLAPLTIVFAHAAGAQ